MLRWLRFYFLCYAGTTNLLTQGKENPTSEKEMDEDDPYSSAEYDQPGILASC